MNSIEDKIAKKLEFEKKVQLQYKEECDISTWKPGLDLYSLCYFCIYHWYDSSKIF